MNQSPWPLIQYNATVESNQQCTEVTFSLPIAVSTFVTRFAAICPDTSSNRGIARFLFAIRDLEHTRPWVVPYSCSITAYTAAATQSSIVTKSVKTNRQDGLLGPMSSVLCSVLGTVRTTPSIASLRFQGIPHPKQGLLRTFPDRGASQAMSLARPNRLRKS
jgi:hypothetical protein